MRRLLGQLVERPIGVGLALLGVIGLGVISLLRLPLTAMPPIERPTVRVEAAVAGASMERIETALVPELEQQLLVVNGVDSVQVWCRDGVVTADVAFRWQADRERARLAVTEAVDGLRLASTPVSWQVSVAPHERPALVILVNGSQGLAARSAVAEDVLVPALAAIPGIARIEILGGVRQRTVVRPLPRRLAAAGIGPGVVRAALRDGIRNLRIGEVTIGGERAGVLVAGAGDEPVAVAAVAVPLPGGGTTSIGELASVAREPWADHGILRVAGQPTVGLALYLSSDANALRIGYRLDQVLTSLAGRLSQGISVEIPVNALDRLRAAIRGLLLAAAIGALVAGLVLALFVRRLAPLCVLVLVIPLSLLAALPAFEALGLSLNLVSLVGMAVSAGMLVDAGVVVLGSCLGQTGTGARRAVNGTSLVARAIIASAVTTAVVFVPALYLHHLAAALFRQLAVALMVTLLASLGFALLAVPVAAARLAPSPRRGESRLQRGYRRLLSRLSSRPAWTLIVVVVCLALCLVAGLDLPQQLLAPETASAVEISFVMPGRLTGVERFPQLDRLLAPLRHPDEHDLLAISPKALSGPPLTTGFWRLQQARGAGQLELLRQTLQAAMPGLVVQSAGPAGTVLEALPLRRQLIEVSGRDRRQVEAAAALIAGALNDAGMTSLSDLPAAVDTVELRPSELGRRLGDRLPAVIATALPAPEPPELGRVRLDESRLARHDLTGAPVDTGNRQLVPLGALAELAPVQRPAVLARRHGQPAATIVVGEATADVAAIEAQLHQVLAGLESEIPAGVIVRLTGGIGDWWQARSQMVLALLLGLALVVLTLAVLYESFRLPLVVLAVLPFAVLGGLLGQRLAGAGLDLGTGLGLVLLVGLSVNNGVLLLDRLRGCSGGPALWARRAAGRLQPVLVTTLTTLVTLAPVAFVGGAGASLRATMARTAFAGLLLSTPAALLVLPALARLLRRREESR
jgi:HAE1 family hydrophobic/amphiphilic exporter-1